jgi:hypothetical protein
LELSWNICPHCTANQATYHNEDVHLPRYAPQPPQRAPQPQRRTGEALEFVEGDEY